MHTTTVRTKIDADHRLSLKVPDDFPTGEMEIVIVANPVTPPPAETREEGMEWLAEPIGEDELALLEDFDRFRAEHPFRLASKVDDETSP